MARRYGQIVAISDDSVTDSFIDALGVIDTLGVVATFHLP